MFLKANLPPQIQVTVLTQVEKFSGCGEFFNSRETGYKTIRVTMMCNFYTSVEGFNSFLVGKSLPKKYFSASTIKSQVSQATHVVIGIERGVSNFLSVERTHVEENVKSSEIELQLKSALIDLASAVHQHKEVTSKTSDILKDANLKWRLYSDFSTRPNYAIPATFRSIEKHLKSMKNCLTNPGTEEPINYVLLPLSDLHEPTKLSLLKETNTGDDDQDLLPEHRLKELVVLFDGIQTVQQRINDFLESMRTKSSTTTVNYRKRTYVT
jgi:hypothetical protein